MSVNMEIFQQFGEQIKTLGDHAQPTDFPPEERVRRVKQVFLKKLDTINAMDLESCIHCGHCASACHYYVGTLDPKYVPIRKLELIKRFYRRELSPMRWLHKLYTRDITAQDLEDWQELVYDSCTECGRCSVACPMGINIAAMVNINRQAYAEAGMIPADLRAVAQEQCAYGTVFGAGPDHLKQALDAMKQQGLEAPLNKEKADVMVLTSVVDIMLFNDALASTIKIMNKLGVDWTFKTCAFEGANFGLLSGNEELQKAASESVVEQAIATGAKLVIVPECGHAYPALRWEGANEHGKPMPFDVMAISEFVGNEIAAGRLKVNPIGKDKKVTFHDPCKIARHGGVIDQPREALKALDVDLRETCSHGVNNWCCGGGAGVFVLNRAAPLRAAAFGIKRKEVDRTGADSVVTSCGSCRLNLLAGMVGTNWDKNVESLIELVGNNLAD
ncbi:MAG: (Fe-S)-binding protein [bacterium]